MKQEQSQDVRTQGVHFCSFCSRLQRRVISHLHFRWNIPSPNGKSSQWVLEQEAAHCSSSRLWKKTKGTGEERKESKDWMELLSFEVEETYFFDSYPSTGHQLSTSQKKRLEGKVTRGILNICELKTTVSSNLGFRTFEGRSSKQDGGSLGQAGLAFLLGPWPVSAVLDAFSRKSNLRLSHSHSAHCLPRSSGKVLRWRPRGKSSLFSSKCRKLRQSRLLTVLAGWYPPYGCVTWHTNEWKI